MTGYSVLAHPHLRPERAGVGLAETSGGHERSELAPFFDAGAVAPAAAAAPDLAAVALLVTASRKPYVCSSCASDRSPYVCRTCWPAAIALSASGRGEEGAHV